MTKLEIYEKMKNSPYFLKTVKRVSKDSLYEYYIVENHTLAECCKYFSVSGETFNSLLFYYSIEKSPKLRFQNRNQQQSKAKEYITNQLLSSVDLEELAHLYLDENWSYEAIKSKYNLSGYMLDKLIRENNLQKSRKQSAQLVIRTKLSTSEPGNYSNWKKGHQTRIKNSGSLEESYRNGLDKYKETCLQKYGYECAFSNPLMKTHRKKKDTGPNKRICNLLTSLKIEYTQEFVIHTKSYDFKIDTTLLEVNPTVTHNSTFSIYGGDPLDKNYHKYKSQIATSECYRCLHIWDWDDTYKIISSLLPKETIYARHCQVKVVKRSESDLFLNSYHFQNTCRGQKWCYGLYYNEKLIQIMTLGKPRYNKNYEYELLRLCTRFGYKVVGGAEKLFKYFITTAHPNSVISYCDNSKFTGDVYNRIGMILKDKGSPTKHWYNEKLQMHITDNFLRQRGFDQLLGDRFGCFGKGTSNDELMKQHGFVEVYDCGQSVYIWSNK